MNGIKNITSKVTTIVVILFEDTLAAILVQTNTNI